MLLRPAKLPKPKFTALDENLYDYLQEHRAPDDEVVRELREETARLGEHASMQVSPDQATFLRLLVAAIGARRAVEVGTFTGFSALAIARGLPTNGRLLCCDVSEEWTSIAGRYWRKAGVADRIELRLGPAAETLRRLPEQPVFDFAFIDADKRGYPAYWDELVPRLRRGGLIAVDNVLWDGDVVRPEVKDADTVAIREFNEKVLDDDRVESVMLPIADGLTLARRR
ncbi:MAG TPA: class I SAM-dependent methyltransferase [Vicinamibacteria bacterium]|nr:class I SAM-dependent methyltransferase [Vicinamibacteria bacterium]